MQQLAQAIQTQLSNPLLGEEAHRLMMSQMRTSRQFQFKKREKTRVSAVLMLLYPKNGEIYMPFILRPAYQGVAKHGGQMGLPGGGREAQDADLTETALRETFEEIGVEVPRNRVLGELSELYIPPSDSLVTPFVAYLEKAPTFKIDPNEVAELFEIKVTDFFDTKNQKVKTANYNGSAWEIPYFDIIQHDIWGATAMMMSEFLEMLQEVDFKV